MQPPEQIYLNEWKPKYTANRLNKSFFTKLYLLMYDVFIFRTVLSWTSQRCSSSSPAFEEKPIPSTSVSALISKWWRGLCLCEHLHAWKEKNVLSLTENTHTVWYLPPVPPPPESNQENCMSTSHIFAFYQNQPHGNSGKCGKIMFIKTEGFVLSYYIIICGCPALTHFGIY